MLFPAIEDKEKEEKVFFASYILWMVAAVIKITMFNDIELVNTICSYMQKIAYLLLICLFFMKRRDRMKDFVGIGLIIICCVLARHSVYNTQIIAVSFYVYFSTDIDLKKILKCTLILQAILMAITMVSSQVGIIEDEIWTRGGSDVARHALGYEFRTYSSHLLLFMTLIWFCLRKKIHVLEVTIAIALNYGLYVLTDGRVDFLLAVVGAVGFFVWGREYGKKWINSIRAFVVKWGFVIAAGISILVQAFYNPDYGLMAAINKALSGRLRLGNEAIQTYGLPIFGTSVRWVGQGSLKADPSLTYNYVDNSFLKEGISYGIVFLILLAIGFYLAGKYLLANKEYKLTWAVLITLAYSVINAHLCVLTFDVFILVLGCCFKETRWGEVPIQEWFSQLLDDHGKSFARTGLILAILCVVTYVQCKGSSYMTDNARMYIWIIAGLILLLGCLCWEADIKPQRILGSGFGKLIFAFLLLLCISDFFVSKTYVYAGFAMLACGGFFCKCWSSMEDPNCLLNEFKLAVKIWFIAGIIYCLLCRPTMSGICYSGMYPDAESYALSMLIALVIFLSDMRKEHWEIVNGIGMVCALYLLWLSKQTIVLLVACLILVIYVAFWIYAWRTQGQESRVCALEKLAISIVAGIVFIIILRGLLPRLSFALGTQIVYENDKSKIIGITLLQLGSIDNWKELFSTKFEYCLEYMRNLNLLGHEHLLEINGKNHWSPNGALMIAYRYGIFAGLCYIGVLAWYLVRAVRQSLQKKEFLLAGIAVSLVLVGMMVTIEQPFVCMAWIALWFGICGISLWNNQHCVHN